MPKPEKVRASGVALFIDGVLTRRVQTLGSNTDITREEISELANDGVVEYVEDSPTVTIQIDTNDIGSTDTMALLTDQMFSYDASSDGITQGTNDPRGGTFKHYIKAASSNATTITEQNMLNGYCSILATLNEDGTSAKRTMYMNRCAVTGVNLSYDVNGNAAENYTLTADNKTWFLNDWANVRCYKPALTNIVHLASAGIHFSYLDSAIPDGSTVVAMGINNTILRARGVLGSTGNATFSPIAGGFFSASSVALSTPWVARETGGIGADRTSSDRVWIIYEASAAATWEASETVANPGFELESSSGAIGALRRGSIKAYLWNTGTTGKTTSTAAGRALRLQTVSIDIALGEEQLLELGTDGFYGISKNTPVPITVNVTANESDLEYFAALMSVDYENTGVNSVDISEFNGNNSLRIEIYKEKAQTNLLKTITIGSMYVNSENFNISVGDNVSQEISFQTDNVSIVGSGYNMTGGPNWV